VYDTCRLFDDSSITNLLLDFMRKDSEIRSAFSEVMGARVAYSSVFLIALISNQCLFAPHCTCRLVCNLQ